MPPSFNHESVTDSREEAYRRLPSWVQPLITLISGLPPQKQLPVFHWTRTKINLTIAAWLLFGIAASTQGSRMSLDGQAIGLPMLVIGWLFTTGAFRASMTTVLHDIVHLLEKHCKRKHELVYNHALGWVGELITILLLIPEVAVYYVEHVLKHHNGKTFCTLADPDAKLLYDLGFQPGKSRTAHWRTFWNLILIPWSRLYCLFTWERMKAQFANKNRALGTVIVWTPIMYAIVRYGALTEFLIAYVVPLLLGIPAAALCQFASEHNWLVKREDKSLRQHMEKTSRGRVFLDHVPAPQEWTARLAFLWLRFWTRTFFVHAPLRIVVCPFDLGTGHDLHHIGDEVIKKDRTMPAWANWMNSGYYRRWVEANCSSEFPLTTYYSLGDALDSVFDTYSKLEPEPNIEATTTPKEAPHGLFGM
jgi:hypothetical protein